jgi:hypothetical protein
MTQDRGREAPAQEPFRFRDPRQARIYRRLQLLGPGPASLFIDACRLMATAQTLLSTTHLVAHCLRDIESALRDVLEPVMEDQDPQEGKSDKSASGDVTHRLEIRAILRGLEIPETEPVAETWLKLPGRNNPYGLHRRAHRNSLNRPRPVDAEFRRFWDDIQSVFDVVLSKFEARYSASHSLIDELLAKTSPTKKDLQMLKGHVPNNSVSFQYFFDQLDSVEWMQPLRNEGFFSSPPEPEQDYEDGGFRFVGWPQSTYLDKMAEVEPATVKEIIQELPPTENIRVHEELAEVTLKLPVHMVAELVPKLIEWAKYPVQWVLPDRMSDLVKRLARGGQDDDALTLARELFALSPHNVYGGTDRATLPPSYDARARFRNYPYTEYLDKCSVVLVEAAGERALTLLCDLLEDALCISVGLLEGRSAGSHPYHDPLHVWRPAIENHGQNHPRGLEGYLISVVRDAAERLAESKLRSVPEIVRLLEERRWRTFDRLAIHLLWRFPDAAPELISERLTDRRRFDDPGLRHEYALLARSYFARLGAEDRAIILGWIEEGPDLEDWKDGREEATGQRPTDEDAARAAKVWRRNRLALLGSVLPAEWNERYEELVEELGPSDHPEFASYTSAMWVGPESPVTADDIRAMTVEEIVAYLKSWRPSGEFMSPSPEGFARELSGVIAEDPERFAVASNRFRELDPTYVRGLLDGLRDAVKQGHAFSWAPVLDLCLWVVRQPRHILGREEYRELVEEHDLDPDWGWTRKTIGELLEEGFKVNGASVPPELRDRSWEVLRPLTNDPEPDAEYEARYGGSNMDPAMLSINTVRGQAMHAVVRYALWVQGHLERTVDGEARLARGFEEMPEVRSVLDEHLEPEKDSSLAVRAVYGQWFPQLILLDESWAVRNMPNIFPSQEPLHELRRAAWETYVVFQFPYDSAFETLHEEYEHAVHQLSSSRSEEWWPGHPEERLVEHLMARYWQGKLNPEDEEDLLAQFYNAAPDELRAHAIEFFTRHLHNPGVEVSEEILTRLRTLGEMRLSSIPKVAPGDRTRELGAFAELFASGKFEKQWALEQLREVVTLGERVDLNRDVIEYLASCAPDMPLLTVRCLEGLIEGSREDWRISVRRETIRDILSAAIQSADVDAQREAKEVANRLIARGYSDFYDLAQ